MASNQSRSDPRRAGYSGASPKIPLHSAPYKIKPKRKVPWGFFAIVILLSLLVLYNVYFPRTRESGISYFNLTGSHEACLKREGLERVLTQSVSLIEGDELFTNESPLTILLSSGTTNIRLGAESHMLVQFGGKADREHNISLGLDYGRCWLQADGENELEIEVRGGKAEIRSAQADFCVKKNGYGKISVWEGEVCFRGSRCEDKKNILLQKGKGLTLKPDGAAIIQPAITDEWKDLNQSLSLNRILTEDLSDELLLWKEASEVPVDAPVPKTHQTPGKARVTSNKVASTNTLSSPTHRPVSLPGPSLTPRKTSSYPTFNPTGGSKSLHSSNFASAGNSPPEVRPGGSESWRVYEAPPGLTDHGLDYIPPDTNVGSLTFVDEITIRDENDLQRRFEKVTSYLKYRYNMVSTRSNKLVIVAKDDFSTMGEYYAGLAQYSLTKNTLFFRENMREDIIDSIIVHEFSHGWLAEYSHFRVPKERMHTIDEGFALWIQMKYALYEKNFPLAALAARGLESPGSRKQDADRLIKYRNGIRELLGIEEKSGEKGVFKFVTTGVNPVETQ